MWERRLRLHCSAAPDPGSQAGSGHGCVSWRPHPGLGPSPPLSSLPWRDADTPRACTVPGERTSLPPDFMSPSCLPASVTPWMWPQGMRRARHRLQPQGGSPAARPRAPGRQGRGSGRRNRLGTSQDSSFSVPAQRGRKAASSRPVRQVLLRWLAGSARLCSEAPSHTPHSRWGLGSHREGHGGWASFSPWPHSQRSWGVRSLLS